ncbi:MAG: AraC family transcriptional regulator [Pseudomonadota bacterium]
MFDHPELAFGWRTALLLVAVIQLLIAAVLLLRREQDRLANRWLAGFMLVSCGVFTPHMIGFAGFYDAWPWLSFAPFDHPLTIGPLMLAYTQALTQGRVPRWTLWLFAPALLTAIYHLYWFIQPLQDKGDWAGGLHGSLIQPALNLLAVLLALVGLTLAVRQLNRYRLWLDQDTSVRSDFDPSWLKTCILIFSLALAVWVVTNLFHTFVRRLSYVQEYPVFLVWAAAAWAMAQLALIRGRDAFPKMPVASGPSNDADDAAISTALDARAQALREAVADQGWYLEPGLSLQDVAQRMGTSQSELSRLINQGLKVNFNRFINEMRVDHAREQLRSTDQDVLTIALGSGFNSKATFNRVFRETAGITPSAWRAREI